MTKVTDAILRALEAAVSSERLSDRQRDQVAGSLDDAIRALSDKQITTAEDTALLDRLESFVLNLRIMGASTHLDKGSIGGKPSA